MAEVLVDIHAVGLQMESIVVDLLDLARCEGGLHVVRNGELALADAVDGLLAEGRGGSRRPEGLPGAPRSSLPWW